MVAACRGVLFAVTISAAASACSERATMTIDRPGTHTLDADVIGAGSTVVHIAANDVILDLNGRAIRCAPSQPATAATFGIDAEHRGSVTIRNGSITGCKFGVSATYGNGIVLEDVNFTGNTYIGANLGFGSSNIVRRCRFAAITGYTVEAYAVGLNGIGSVGLVEHNTFENLYRQPGANGVGEGVGVLVEAGATNVVVRDNTFTNTEPREQTIGVWSARGAVTTMTANTLVNFAKGAQGFGLTVTGNSFRLTGPVQGGTAILGDPVMASDNTITGYSTPVLPPR
jgi:hypothetical protein